MTDTARAVSNERARCIQLIRETLFHEASPSVIEELVKKIVERKVTDE